jgi:Antirestriction protein
VKNSPNYELSNGGMYMAPRIPSVRLSIQSNGFQGQMSADAAGVTVCLFAFSLLSFEGNDEVFARHFHWLREFALGHVEATQIFGAID